MTTALNCRENRLRLYLNWIDILRTALEPKHIKITSNDPEFSLDSSSLISMSMAFRYLRYHSISEGLSWTHEIPWCRFLFNLTEFYHLIINYFTHFKTSKLVIKLSICKITRWIHLKNRNLSIWYRFLHISTVLLSYNFTF